MYLQWGGIPYQGDSWFKETTNSRKFLIFNYIILDVHIVKVEHLFLETRLVETKFQIEENCSFSTQLRTYGGLGHASGPVQPSVLLH